MIPASSRSKQPPSEYYSRRTTPQGYRIVKFDEAINVLAIYELIQRRGYVSCQCFQASKHTCRHRQMIEIFIQYARVDQGWFYAYDTGEWLKPLISTRRRKR